MSRSVKPDYDKLREPKPKLFGYLVSRQGDNVVVALKLDEGAMFGMLGREDARYLRKTESRVISPTNEDWAKYHRAKSGLLALQAYEGTWGIHEVEIEMPKPRTQHDYTETHAEWLERCHTLQAERKAA